MPRLDAANIFRASVFTYAEATSHGQVRTNGYIAEMARPAKGACGVVMWFILFGATVASPSRRASDVLGAGPAFLLQDERDGARQRAEDGLGAAEPVYLLDR